MMESFIPGEKEILADLVHILVVTYFVFTFPEFFLFNATTTCDVLFLPCAGHSDSQSRNTPTLVKDISGVGQVACGSSHTIAVAQDGRTVWSFGGGDNGMSTDSMSAVQSLEFCISGESISKMV